MHQNFELGLGLWLVSHTNDALKIVVFVARLTVSHAVIRLTTGGKRS